MIKQPNLNQRNNLKLPIKTGENIVALLKNEASKSLLYYKVFFIKGIMDEVGQIAEGAIAPRFITLWSDSFFKLNEAVESVKKLIGTSVSYELSIDSHLPEDATDHEITSLHKRSRLLKADEVIAVLQKATIEISWAYLMKSSLHIQVIDANLKHPELGKMYQSKVFVRPSTADIIYSSGDIVDADFIGLFERTIKSPLFNYEEEIDKNFDTLFIDTPFFRGEIVPPETNKELMELIRKNLLAVGSGKTSHDSIQDKSKK
jgi:hypothetical protein